MAPLIPFYLLDTNILVHLVRGDAVWTRVRAHYQPLLVAPRALISVISAGELRSLALQFNWQAEKIDQMEPAAELFQLMNCWCRSQEFLIIPLSR